KKLVRLAAQRQQLLSRGLHGGRLVEQAAVAGECRIAAYDHGRTVPGRDAQRLHLGQRLGDLLRRGARGEEAACGLCLVDARRLDFELKTGMAEELTAGEAG